MSDTASQSSATTPLTAVEAQIGEKWRTLMALLRWTRGRLHALRLSLAHSIPQDEARASASSLRRAVSTPSSSTQPDVGRSSRPSRYSSDDLPDPEGPMITTNSPAPRLSDDDAPSPLATERG